MLFVCGIFLMLLWAAYKIKQSESADMNIYNNNDLEFSHEAHCDFFKKTFLFCKFRRNEKSINISNDIMQIYF